MAILDAITLAQKQILTHILTEMEARGVESLAQARLIVARNTAKHHTHRQSKRYQHPVPQQPAYTCPECGAPMQIYPRTDLDDTIIRIVKCGKCAYSYIDGEVSK